MPRTRTFLAVDVGGGVRDRALAAQHALAKAAPDGVNWVSADNLHVTLVFLGEVDDRELHAVCRAAAAAARTEPPLELTFRGLGAFPSPRRPRTVWAGVAAGADALRRLHARLAADLVGLGAYRREAREYSPHLTLGRVTAAAAGPAVAAALPRLADWDGGAARAAEVLVMASDLRADGPAYTVVGRAGLGGREIR